jgi:hypothetical protein
LWAFWPVVPDRRADLEPGPEPLVQLVDRLTADRGQFDQLLLGRAEPLAGSMLAC